MFMRRKGQLKWVVGGGRERERVPFMRVSRHRISDLESAHLDLLILQQKASGLAPRLRLAEPRAAFGATAPT